MKFEGYVEKLPIHSGDRITIKKGTMVRCNGVTKPAGKTYKVTVHHVLNGYKPDAAEVAYQERHEFSGFRHMAVPVFGAVANFACMAFYIIGPIEGLGSVKEPLMAVAIAAVWGIYGAFYFMRNSKKRGKDTILVGKPA